MLHERIELSFFNSLSRKLASLYIFVLFGVALIFLTTWQTDVIQDVLSDTALSPEAMATVEQALSNLRNTQIFITLLMLGFISFMVWYLRFLIVRPLNQMVDLLSEVAEGEGDLSKNMPVLTHDEIGKLARTYNLFLSGQRSIIANVHSLTMGIAQHMEHVATSNSDINSLMTQIHEASQLTDNNMQASSKATRDLSAVAEKVQGTIGRFVLGHGELDASITRAGLCRDKIQSSLNNLQAQCTKMFDKSYSLIAGTNPQQYGTAYTDKLIAAVQNDCDQLVKATSGGKVAFVVDQQGYCPVNNSWFSKKPTGDPSVDLLSSRDKRIFNDPSGMRAAANNLLRLGYP